MTTEETKVEVKNDPFFYNQGKGRDPIPAEDVINTSGLILPNARTLTKDGRTFTSGYLSISQMNLYRTCQRAFMYKYVDHLREKPSTAMIEGSGCHAAAEFVLKEIVAGKPTPALSDCLDKFRDSLMDSIAEAGSDLEWAEGESPSKAIDLNHALLKKFYTETVPTLKPLYVEKAVIEHVPVLGTSGTIPVNGYIDLGDMTADGECVVDFKTGRNLKSSKDLTSSSQLAFYALARKASRAGFITMKKGTLGRPGGVSLKTAKPLKGTPPGEPVIQRLEDTKTAGDFAIFIEDLSNVAHSISAGYFDRSGRESWRCPSCPYRATCLGKE